jgi:hypothetical protein
MALTSRISKKTDSMVNEMVHITGKTKVEILEEAVKLYRHYERMRMVNEAYAKLRKDKKAWKEELKERQILEGTIEDGIEN